MSGLDRLLDPAAIAIAGLSVDQGKHGGRVLGHLRRLGYRGEIYGVNPGLPSVEGVEMVARVSDLFRPPDLVVCAIPAAAARAVALDSAGAGALVVFAGGFGESGPDGWTLEADLVEVAAAAGVRVLGPNSGGVIRPGRGLAASFLTCLDRPPDQIRSGPVGVVTQSGGTGSYLHNLAAARGTGLAVSVSTGNEIDIRLGEAIDAVSGLEEVRVVLALIETVRDGEAFIEAVRRSVLRGKPVVACRIGTGARGKSLMTTHTGAMALPERVLQGVLDSLGVVVVETPGEAYEVAEMMARADPPAGPRAVIVTHSGGIAIHLADLAERAGLDLPPPGPALRSRLQPLLELGAANNPLDMGGIIGGPGRFAQVVETFAGCGEYDLVLAVSTAHPPAHTEERVEGLLQLVSRVPILHLWMAGDQASHGLESLRGRGLAVTEEPRAAIRAMAGLANLTGWEAPDEVEPIVGDFEGWGLPLVEGEVVVDAETAVAAAERLGYPVVVKMASPGLAHKTEVGGVVLDIGAPDSVRRAFERVVGAAHDARFAIDGVRVERFQPGLELVVGALVDPVFGPMVSVGMGGVLTEVLGDVVFSPAPVDDRGARDMIRRLRGRRLLDGFRGAPPADVDGLVGIVCLLSRGLVGSSLSEVEINPLVWSGTEWVAVDWLVR
ncbi:MAG: acetate--CoA ligase family protein [Acidimicrobiia bacterium]